MIPVTLIRPLSDLHAGGDPHAEWLPVTPEGEPGQVFTPEWLPPLDPNTRHLEKNKNKTKSANSAGGRHRRNAETVLRTISVGEVAGKNRKQRKQLKQAYKESRATLAAYSDSAEVKWELPSPLPKSKLWGKFERDGLWGPISPGVPWHKTSANRIGGATMFLAPHSEAISGPVIGVEVSTGQPFTYDSWQAIIAGLTTSPSVVICGLMNRGKSFGAKVVLTRMVVNGRQVIIAADPKGEWINLALALGGQIIDIGPGSNNIMNPLEEGTKPVSATPETWRRMVLARRALALESICYILRDGQPLTSYERYALSWVVTLMAEGRIPATISATVSALKNPSQELLADLTADGAQAPRVLAITLSELTTGALAGMFDGDSTVKLDPAAPMVVVSTKRFGTGQTKLKQIGSAVTSGWIDAVLRSEDGRYRILANEEAWDNLANPVEVEVNDDRIRLTGQYRCSVWNILHELSDLKQLGELGSAHRNRVEGIISKSETKILYAQSQASLDEVDRFIKPTASERRQLTTLPRGVAMWHIGQETPIMVHAIAGPRLYRIINTDAGRSGR